MSPCFDPNNGLAYDIENWLPHPGQCFASQFMTFPSNSEQKQISQAYLQNHYCR